VIPGEFASAWLIRDGQAASASERLRSLRTTTYLMPIRAITWVRPADPYLSLFLFFFSLSLPPVFVWFWGF